MENSQIVIRGRYKVIQEISRGGMGVVFLALDLLKNQEVAVKKSFFSGTETARKGFEIEAKLLARLDHEGLPKVVDYFFLEDNSQALVMDFITGETLMGILESGKLRQGRGLNVLKVLDWTLQILDILRYLHNFEPPIVHRDIKPNNIKLTREGKIILLDFGLAKGSAQTLVGGMSGYSPIEQIQQTGTDTRSDIYALGTTLFHLWTDEYPLTAIHRFQEIYSEATSAGALSLKPDPQKNAQEFNPQIPPMVSEIVMKAMALMPENRFQTADEMKSEVLKVKRSLEYGISKFGEITNFEISEDLGKQHALIDETEENLPAWQSAKKVEKQPEISEIISTPIPKPPELNKLKDTVSSEALFGESIEKEVSQNNLIDDISMPETPIEIPIETPVFLPKPDEAQPKKNNPQIALAIASTSFLILITALGISAWYLLTPAKTQEMATVHPNTFQLNNSPDSAPTLAKKDETPKKNIEIAKYGIGKNGKFLPLEENYRLAEGEKFRFNVKSLQDGFLYIISRDGSGDISLAYPRQNRKDNVVKKDSEKVFPPHIDFKILEDTIPEIMVYFVRASSREEELVRRIREVLADGNGEMKISSSAVSELISDLDKLAEDSNSSETVSVKILKLQKR
ncbi:MAG TPA: protein kinase [Pyrinomonadaceae bacterium]|nr:protein kinase [Pyrinomonadaceae bacterium]